MTTLARLGGYMKPVCLSNFSTIRRLALNTYAADQASQY